MKKLSVILISLNLIVFYSCSASTDSRYGGEKKDTGDKGVVIKDKEPEVEIVEDFDFTPYRTKLDIPKKEISIPTQTPKSEIWYGYEDIEIDTSSSSNKKIIDKVQGYRVLILTTDNLEEANNMRSEIYFNTEQKDVYVVFDPPFYKVMVGDFTEYSEAKDLSFKMNQLGYTESRVVNETVNIFE
jgi:CRISPR/Cas system-associated exonuclease Cas4 (RecB family)